MAEYLICSTADSEDYIYVNFNSDDDPNVFIDRFEKILDWNTSSSLCVTLSYYYRETQWIGSLDVHNQYSKNKQDGTTIETRLELDERISDGMIVRPSPIRIVHTCSLNMKCALTYIRQLVQNHAQWLLTGGSRYLQLWRALENILIKREAIDTSKGLECYKTLTKIGFCTKRIAICMAILVGVEWKSPQCGDIKHVITDVNLEIIKNKKDKQYIRTIEYTCGFHQCNSRNITIQVQKVIDRYFEFQLFLITSSIKTTASIVLKITSSLTTVSDRFITSKMIPITTEMETITITNETILLTSSQDEIEFGNSK